VRIVVDTNVLVSGIFWNGNESTILKACKTRDLTNYISPDIINEFERVLHYEKFRLTASEINSVLETILVFSTVVVPQIKLDVIKDDPTDNIVLECGLTANAECIISGDNHLLRLGKYTKMKIMSAKIFIDTFKI
jgi:putative PIN family toxin of toxin-antitoxin system